MAHHDQLRSVAELGDQVEEPVEVHVVERGLHLVHHVERRRPGAEHREQVRQRGQRALAARQQRQLADVLARRPGLELDAGLEQVVRIGEPEPTLTTGEEGLEQQGEVLADIRVGGGEDADDLLVDRLDHLRELAPGLTDVLELGLEERVTLGELVELLEGQRVDRAHEAQLALELPHPGGGADALGQRRALGGHRGVGLGVEIVTK